MNFKRIVVFIVAILMLGLALDLTIPVKKNFKQFDPEVVGKLDAEMWRSYYERKPVKLFFQLSKLMREQFHSPYFRSYLLAYYSVKAAFVFKDGRNRIQYASSLPYLSLYFAQLKELSDTPFNPHKLAQEELEWWIIRREHQQYSPSDWEKILSKEGEIMFHVPAEKFTGYAKDRVSAMLLRDEKGQAIDSSDWEAITKLCVQAWTKFHAAVQPNAASSIKTESKDHLSLTN